jgi:hypothetical protein
MEVVGGRGGGVEFSVGGGGGGGGRPLPNMRGGPGVRVAWFIANCRF